jgi:hypothetical protein
VFANGESRNQKRNVRDAGPCRPMVALMRDLHDWLYRNCGYLGNRLRRGVAYESNREP